MGANVLVVDDEPDIRELLEILLADDPRADVVASTGELDCVLPLAADVAPDVVILDVMFGHRTCAEILPELRAASPQSRIVVFTASRRNALSLGLLDLGANVILQKVTASFDEVIDQALDGPAVDAAVDERWTNDRNR